VITVIPKKPRVHFLLDCKYLTTGYPMLVCSGGFKTILIAPDFGSLKSVNASFPHPLGKVSVQLVKKNKSIRGYVELPNGLNGIFRFNGRKMALKGGSRQAISF
jgi:Bacterial alpha-L-rhamnosidase C-terminal domain